MKKAKENKKTHLRTDMEDNENKVKNKIEWILLFVIISAICQANIFMYSFLSKVEQKKPMICTPAGVCTIIDETKVEEKASLPPLPMFEPLNVKVQPIKK